MNQPARPSVPSGQMADSSARMMMRVRPLLRLKSAASPVTEPKPADATKQTASLQSATRNKKPRKSPAKSQSATRNSGAVSAPKKAKEKPPTVAGYHWRSNGVGWELRRPIIIEGRRTHRYVGHLSKSAYREMKRQHKGNAFADALAGWIAEKERE